MLWACSNNPKASPSRDKAGINLICTWHWHIMLTYLEGVWWGWTLWHSYIKIGAVNMLQHVTSQLLSSSQQIQDHPWKAAVASAWTADWSELCRQRLEAGDHGDHFPAWCILGADDTCGVQVQGYPTQAAHWNLTGFANKNAMSRIFGFHFQNKMQRAHHGIMGVWSLWNCE